MRGGSRGERETNKITMWRQNILEPLSLFSSTVMEI